MAKKAVIQLAPGIEAASILLEDHEFNSLCSDMEEWFELMGHEWAGHVQRAREARFIPELRRDSQTQRFFDIFGIPDNIMIMQIVTEEKAKEMQEEMEKAFEQLRKKAQAGRMNRPSIDPGLNMN